MTSFLRRVSVVGAMLLFVSVSFGRAQTPGAGRQGSPMYDVNSETTIKGTVESVEIITGLVVAGDVVWVGRAWC